MMDLVIGNEKFSYVSEGKYDYVGETFVQGRYLRVDDGLGFRINLCHANSENIVNDKFWTLSWMTRGFRLMIWTTPKGLRTCVEKDLDITLGKTLDTTEIHGDHGEIMHRGLQFYRKKNEEKYHGIVICKFDTEYVYLPWAINDLETVIEDDLESDSLEEWEKNFTDRNKVSRIHSFVDDTLELEEDDSNEDEDDEDSNEDEDDDEDCHCFDGEDDDEDDVVCG